MAVQRRRTPRPTLDKPWRNDFSTVPAEARRAARYTLQLVANRPECLDRLEDPDFTGALWALCLPLIDPAVLSSLQATWEVCTAEDASNERIRLKPGMASASHNCAYLQPTRPSPTTLTLRVCGSTG